MAHNNPKTEADEVENEKLLEMIRQEIKEARDRGDISRRDLMKAGGLAGLTALVGGGLAASTETAAAASGDNEEARAYLSTDTSVSSGTSTQIVLDAESYDPNGNFDTSTGEYTAPSAGTYLVKWVARFSNPTDGSQLAADIDLNGSGYTTQMLETAGAADDQTVQAVDTLDLASGDTLSFMLFQKTGGSVTVAGSEINTYATVHKLGGGSGSSDHVNPDHEPNTTYNNINSSRPMISTEHLEFYVSADGSDTNSGTQSSPLATLQEVADRLPYMLFHGLDVYIEPNSSGPATQDSGGIFFPPIWTNFVGDASDVTIKANGTDPNNHVIDSRGLSFSFNGQEPNKCIGFYGLKFDTRPQNYRGTAYFENCTFLSDTDTSQDMAIGGYAGKNYFFQCTFGGDVVNLSQFNQGHEFMLLDCDGTFQGAILDNGGLNAQTLYIDDNGSDEMTYGGYVTDTGAPSLVIHNGQIAYPSTFK